MNSVVIIALREYLHRPAPACAIDALTSPPEIADHEASTSSAP
ncbi:hypothetical protein ACIRTP_08445 [Pseudomonas aeruginosa]